MSTTTTKSEPWVDKETFGSVFLATLAAGLIIMVLGSMFGHWLSGHGQNIVSAPTAK